LPPYREADVLRFIHTENLIHLRKQLTGSLDAVQRGEILRQIAMELLNAPRTVTNGNADNAGTAI